VALPLENEASRSERVTRASNGTYRVACGEQLSSRSQARRPRIAAYIDFPRSLAAMRGYSPECRKIA